ncbi:GNAT family N-acetyltransferase [Anaerobacillus sp. CMMVII]|uniref:GNAT family N-acetyltransferase n=1 Tax=Anaerobacillus sp. CMMVII TaxID=2755588 RepID=UPI0021B80897|nr:GNAT family N-acetyltransferase [Anaerobacillus sp. CMMVII]MCT8137172.1 GNAT family N-acetyltransferase [Anaerobacillus sp. CMMVII]
MNVKIKKAALHDKELIKNLMQFYFYDFSEFVEAHVEEDGRFGDYPYLDSYWEEKTRFPYLVEVDGKYAGFVLVRQIEENERTYFSIAEFFIMKKSRRTGVGRVVATEMFSLHPGNWEVFQIEKNVPAQYFWRKVISEYTNGNFTERTVDKKVIQEFKS